jgi:hypothetical protein
VIAADAARRFPPPWSAEEGETYFVVKDNDEQRLAYVHFDDPRSAAKPLTRDEAGRIAAKIAKLPELPRQRPNTRVLSAFLLTRREAFVYTCSVTENAVRAPILTPIFARLRGKGQNRSAYQAK